MLIGHQTQRDAFMQALAGGRLHHAWLLAGPRGIGKRAFADAAALRLLAGGKGGFGVPPDHPTARLIAAGSHMDRRVLTRELNDQGKLRAVITVDQVRSLQPVLRGTPVLGDWRAIIVDSADDMNPSASNALLKNLEEPPQRTLFLLVSHSPSSLLPTIRSRCRTVRFQPLSDAETDAVLLAGAPEGDADDRAAQVRLANGRPGEVSGLAGKDIAALDLALDRLLAGGQGAATAFARAFGPASAAGRFDALCRVAPARIAAAARAAPTPEALHVHAEAEALASGAVQQQLERSQVAFALAQGLLATASQPHGATR